MEDSGSEKLQLSPGRQHWPQRQQGGLPSRHKPCCHSQQAGRKITCPDKNSPNFSLTYTVGGERSPLQFDHCGRKWKGQNHRQKWRKTLSALALVTTAYPTWPENKLQENLLWFNRSNRSDRQRVGRSGHVAQTTNHAQLKQARACAGNWRMGDQLCIYYIGKQRLHYANETWLAQVPLHYRLGHRHSVTHLVSLFLWQAPPRARAHTVQPSGACQCAGHKPAV